MPKITTILFDCDNTLVLSEDLAFEACAEVANSVLAKNGIPDRYTGPQLIREFVGMNVSYSSIRLLKADEQQLTLVLVPWNAGCPHCQVRTQDLARR